MERPNKIVSDQEAVEALQKLSVYCEDNRCDKCMFRRVVGYSPDKRGIYQCIMGLYHPYFLRVVSSNGEFHVVSEWEAINNEN